MPFQWRRPSETKGWKSTQQLPPVKRALELGWISSCNNPTADKIFFFYRPSHGGEISFKVSWYDAQPWFWVNHVRTESQPRAVALLEEAASGGGRWLGGVWYSGGHDAA